MDDRKWIVSEIVAPIRGRTADTVLRVVHGDEFV